MTTVKYYEAVKESLENFVWSSGAYSLMVSYFNPPVVNTPTHIHCAGGCVINPQHVHVLYMKNSTHSKPINFCPIYHFPSLVVGAQTELIYQRMTERKHINSR